VGRLEAAPIRVVVDAAFLAVVCAVVCGCWLLLAATIALARLRARLRGGRPVAAAVDDWTVPARREAFVDDSSTVGDARALLLRGLRSDEREVRIAAITALSGLAREHEWALDGLVEALASEVETPERVATELDRLAPRPATRLVPLLGHPSEVVRFYAVRLLARYDRLARRHVPRMTCDPSANVRAASLEVLGAVPSGGALRCALRALDDPSPTVRAHAARTVLAIAPAVAPYVVPLLADTSWWVREAAREALVAAGGGASPAVERALRGPDAVLRNGAALVLQDVGLVDQLVAADDDARFEPILAAGGARLRSAASERATRRGAAVEPMSSMAWARS
jgi:HEAT repeat protein